MTTVGRNDPCPCGSGRKFKHCCRHIQDVEDDLRVRLRSAEGALVPALFSYAAQEFGNEFFDEAWDEFFLWTDVPDDVEHSREFGTTFDPFFVFDFVPDGSEQPPPDGWPTEPLALHFLHHEVESAPELHRKFIEQACKSPASFFVVEAVIVGRALDIRDILTGRRFHVLEQSASRTLHVGDVLFTRVVTAGGGSIMIGACPWVIPASWHIPIIEMRERLRAKRLLTCDELLDYDLEIRQAYHEIVDALLHPSLPVMQNTDGDPLELTTLTYELGVTVTEAVERLTPLATLRGQVHRRRRVRPRRHARRRHADVDQGRQSQAQGLGQHDARHTSPRWFQTRGRGQLRASPSSYRKRDREIPRIGDDAGRYDGHRLDQGSREAARNAFTCAIAPLDPGRFATGARTPSHRGRARTQALGRLARHQGTGAWQPNAAASRQNRVRS